MSSEKYMFDKENEEVIKELRIAVSTKAEYDLRKVFGVMHRLNDKVRTGETDAYGDPIENWRRVGTKELIDFFSEMNALNFYSTPTAVQAFIESSLADIIYKYEFNTAITDTSIKGTVGIKNSLAELEVQDAEFAKKYREMYTKYVIDTMKAFDTYVRRVEKIIDWRIQEERMNASRKAATN